MTDAKTWAGDARTEINIGICGIQSTEMKSTIRTEMKKNLKGDNREGILMSGVLVLLLYIVSAMFGFCGGIFGYYFAKRMEKIKAEKEEPKTIVMDC